MRLRSTSLPSAVTASSNCSPRFKHSRAFSLSSFFRAYMAVSLSSVSNYWMSSSVNKGIRNRKKRIPLSMLRPSKDSSSSSESESSPACWLSKSSASFRDTGGLASSGLGPQSSLFFWDCTGLSFVYIELNIYLLLSLTNACLERGRSDSGFPSFLALLVN